MSDVVNSFNELEFFDPQPILVKLRRLELEIAELDMDPKLRALRTSELKVHRERRDAAIFTFGMGIVQGVRIVFAPVEASDYDFVTLWQADETQHFCPVQLKELVPEHLNPSATLGALLDSTRRYSSSTDTVLAVKLNRRGKIDLTASDFSQVPFKEAWCFWSASESGDRWCMYGDAKGEPGQAEFDYPQGAAV